MLKVHLRTYTIVPTDQGGNRFSRLYEVGPHKAAVTRHRQTKTEPTSVDMERFFDLGTVVIGKAATLVDEIIHVVDQPPFIYAFPKFSVETTREYDSPNEVP